MTHNRYSHRYSKRLGLFGMSVCIKWICISGIAGTYTLTATLYIGDACEGWMDQHLSKSQPLHSQSIQHIRKTYFRSWKSYAALKKSGGVRNPKPPRKTKKYMTTRWLKSAIHFKDELLSLSMGAGRDRLEIPLPKKFDMSKSHLISTIDLVYDFGQWALHFTYTDKINPESAGKGICSVDVGEIHPIVSNDGEHTEIYNGRYIRSLYRQRNKVLADFSRAMSRCDRRFKKVVEIDASQMETYPKD